MYREIKEILKENKQLSLEKIENILHKMNPHLSISNESVLSLKQALFLYDRMDRSLKSESIIENHKEDKTRTSPETSSQIIETNLKPKKENTSKNNVASTPKPHKKAKKGLKNRVQPLGKPMFEPSNPFKNIIKTTTNHLSPKLPPEFFYDKEIKKERSLSLTNPNNHNRIISGEYEVTQIEKEKFRKDVNLRSKEFVRKSLQCYFCARDFIEGFRYTNREGWIYYVCRSCAVQIGGASGRKTIIYTPMGGQNKR